MVRTVVSWVTKRSSPYACYPGNPGHNGHLGCADDRAETEVIQGYSVISIRDVRKIGQEQSSAWFMFTWTREKRRGNPCYQDSGNAIPV